MNGPEEVAAPAKDVQQINSKILEYISEHGHDLSFTKAFWKECEPHISESVRYPLYVRALQLHGEGLSAKHIAETIRVKLKSVSRWTRYEQKPKLAHFLALYLRLGEPRTGRVWLSVNNTPGHAVPLGPIIEVPKVVESWGDVAQVLAQLKPINNSEDDPSREYMFGFFIGMMIGDASKSKSKNWHRHVGLVLSKKYGTNLAIGQFTCKCAENIGLRMHRVSDQPKPGQKPHGFYQWTSRASPLVDWIFNVCLGLRDGERTTYDAVRMGWALAASEEFRRGLVQGIAESDGSVSIASQTVEFWIGPNWNFFGNLLQTFEVKSFRNREALSVTRTQVSRLGLIPAFSPILRTVRFQRFEKLVHAKHIGHGKRVPSEIRNYIREHKNGISIPRLSEKVLEEFNVVLTFEAVQRWAGKS